MVGGGYTQQKLLGCIASGKLNGHENIKLRNDMATAKNCLMILYDYQKG